MDSRDRHDQADQAGRSRRPGRDQQARIEELQRRAGELASGNMMYGHVGDIDGSVLEAFWEKVVAYEDADKRRRAGRDSSIRTPRG